MKKPIAVAATVLALGVAGTAVAAPGGNVFGGSSDDKQAEFASGLAQKLDGVNANEVEQGISELRAERETEMLNERAQNLASQLDGVSVEQATAALNEVQSSAEEGTRPDRAETEKLLAEALGVSEEDLQNAQQAEATERLDQAVEDGKVTEDQADEIREQIESGEMPKGGRGHGGAGGPGHGGPGAGGPGGESPEAGA